MTVIGIGDWYGDVNIYHSPKPYPTDGHPDATDLAEAEAFGAEMVDVSRRLSAGEEVALPGVPMMPPPPPRDPELMPPVFPTPIKACVEYDREKCLYPKCTLCMDNCPVDGIDVTVEPAVYMNPCFECEVCLMLCPTGAVHADEFMEYYTPGTSMGGVLKKVFLPWLENEETQGRFRRHVEVEDIGWETPLSLTMRGKHPQFIIGKGFVKSDSSGPASE
jgi:ferredoxin